MTKPSADQLSTDEVLAKIDALATVWVGERDDRFQRRHLERADFDHLAETGFLRLIVPESHGGMWRSMAETGPILVDAVERIARGDSRLPSSHRCIHPSRSSGR